MSTKIEEILDNLKALTLLEASELVKKIEETFGVDANISVVSTSFSSLNAGAKQEELVVEEKTEFDVIINEVPASKRITVIKVVRSLTSLGLKEAKDLIESVPKLIFEAVTKEKAEEVKKLLEDAGALVIIK